MVLAMASSGDGSPPDRRARWSARTIEVIRTGTPPTTQQRTLFDVPAARFELRDELGRGGMGRVVEAYDVTLDRAVAIKQPLDDDALMLARFEREVRITARLQHPGIVPVLEAGRDSQGRPYFVMRKFEGSPLADRVRDAKSVRARLALVPN